MSKLNDLIKELCPDGVEYKPLDSFATIVRGNGLQKKDFTEDGVGCIHYGQIYTYYGTYAYETKSKVSVELAETLKKVETGDLVVAVTSENIEDVCKCVAWLGEETIVTGGHAAIIKHKQNSKYLAYYFQTEDFYKQKVKIVTGTKVMDIAPSKMGKIIIPIPPLPVQCEIVRILDNFTALTSALTSALTAELTAQRKRYSGLLNSLLSYEGRSTQDGVLWKKLGDAVGIKRGVRVVKAQLNEVGEYPVYQNSLTALGNYNYFNCNANKTFLITAGAAGEIGYSYVPFWAADDCYYFECNDSGLMERYLYYALKTRQYKLKRMVRNASVPRLGRYSIENLLIPVPSLEEQQRIVDILDRFDKLCNNLSEGLPAEIAARQKQYEYYRDKLLTFNEKKA